MWIPQTWYIFYKPNVHIGDSIAKVFVSSVFTLTLLLFYFPSVGFSIHSSINLPIHSYLSIECMVQLKIKFHNMYSSPTVHRSINAVESRICDPFIFFFIRIIMEYYTLSEVVQGGMRRGNIYTNMWYTYCINSIEAYNLTRKDFMFNSHQSSCIKPFSVCIFER